MEGVEEGKDGRGGGREVKDGRDVRREGKYSKCVGREGVQRNIREEHTTAVLQDLARL